MSKKPRLDPERRQHIIEQYIADETEGQLAERCGCCRDTISRQITAWQKTSAYDEWLDRQWLSEYRAADHADRFDKLSRFKEKRIAQKIEGSLSLEIKGYGLGGKNPSPKRGSEVPTGGGEAEAVP